jgi:haloalkane dehalogenase
MGQSDKHPSGCYRFLDHARYLDAWIESLGLDQPVPLVGHDWGGALGFDWACRHPRRMAGLVYMETIVRPLTWEEWPGPARKIFEVLRSPRARRSSP